jgi:hypothetical protein
MVFGGLGPGRPPSHRLLTRLPRSSAVFAMDPSSPKTQASRVAEVEAASGSERTITAVAHDATTGNVKHSVGKFGSLTNRPEPPEPERRRVRQERAGRAELSRRR